MKKYLILLTMMVFISAPTNPHPEVQVKHVAEAATMPPITTKTKLKVKSEFMKRLALYESAGVIDTVNRFGMMGKYQFSKSTLKTLGFDVTQQQFLANEALQDSAMVALIRRNKKILRNVIKTYDGKYFNGVLITTSGLIAGAHLVGPGGVLAYFYPEKYPHLVVDGNGVHVEYYITKFGGYTI